MSGLCPVCPMDVEGPHFADRQRRPLPNHPPTEATQVDESGSSEPSTERGRGLLRAMRLHFPDERGEEWRKEIIAIEAEARAASPKGEPASAQAVAPGLDVERLEAAYDRHFDAPDHYDECGSACFQTFMATYAATDPDAKEAEE